MPLDSAQNGLGLEIALLRALGERRRRRSLADRLLRERRDVKNSPSARVEKMTIGRAQSLQSPTAPWKPDGPHRLD